MNLVILASSMTPVATTFGLSAAFQWWGLPHLAIGGMVVCLPFLMLIIYWGSPFCIDRETRRACALEAVHAGFCGACGYPLPQPTATEQAQPSEHLARCPECGAAWKL